MGNWRKVGAFLGLVPDDRHYPESEDYSEYDEYPGETGYADDPAGYSAAGYDAAETYDDGYASAQSYQQSYPVPGADYQPDYRPSEPSPSFGGAAAAIATMAPAAATVATSYQTHGALAVQPELSSEPLADSTASSRPVKVKLTGFAQAREVGERYREGQAVILDMTEMDDANARRLVDFAAGLAFARHGSIDKVATRVFMVHQSESGQ